ncbi:DNA-binding domain-containing protein [Aquicoccus sp. G2-2]|uniref:HvfC/BufC N-terminal domain-containing protein n=1 Tax=Aquicoccus sp. G2-2 TaxID=3092120 RepID=UPI002AE07084|nr:DNA-binding domain-containing protein [Aquicoccus sp. G2-2]MEA1112700.1 DNA-binding domain-containing protein [Aquicoccus sp. G2-2]
MSLSQTAFRAALLDPAKPTPPGLADGAGNPAGRRFSVYRNNVTASLTEALRETFPVVLKLIGEENFNPIATMFLRAQPPQSPILARYGADFPDFLATFEPLAHLGYLADTARLEHALVRAYHAADCAPLDAAIFTETPPDALPRLHLGFAPPVQLLRSPWPIHGIWRFNTEDGAPQPPAEPQDVLITRPEFDPRPRLLPPGGAAFIATLAAARPLGAALDAATAQAADFDLSAMLSLLLQDNALSSATQGSAA